LDPDCPPVLDLGVLADGRLAAPAAREPGDIAFERRDCPVLELYEVPGEDPGTWVRGARLSGERFPQRSQHSPRLVGALDGRVRYQAAPARPGRDLPPQALPLLPLPRPVYPTAAQVTPHLGAQGLGLDSGRPDTPWHRVYIDGCIPPGCRLTLMAKAFDDPATRMATPFVVQPAPLWSPLVSELPFHAGLAPSRPGESGLFEVLLQHDSGAVRTLTGRYLQLRIRMESDGRRTPAIHALRVYAPRFSYQERYLPEWLRQRAAREDGGTATLGPANGADVRERLLAAFEGVLTPIEGRIAAAETLLDPEAAPLPMLAGLAAALGLQSPPQWPEARRRRLLAEGGLVQQWRGTYPGLCLALDIATGGAVARGQVVVVENFRLRRTFATILGLDLDDRDHPLTLGTGMNGNSIIGDSLILSDEDSRTFLALLAPELGADTALSPAEVAALPAATRAEVATVRAFFDRYSHRVSVLLHGAARAERVLVEQVLAQELPAHLQWRIIETDHPFVLGLAPLLGVDSFLEETPPAARVTMDRTRLGREGLLRNPIALSPRAVNAAPA
jgi:phage tail-like protein